MDSNYYKKYEPIFGSWNIAEKIGEGSFGQVFIIERNEMGVKYRSALKAITIPQNPSEQQSMVMDGMSEENITQYYRGIVQDIINEFILMSKLKGNSNVVSYEDHIIIEHEDGIGWDILIRMELLTPLYDYIAENKMTKKDIINFGIDMCKALELCEKNNIIHRDIKPENIFVSANGDYKLGDFGVARTLEDSVSGLSKKGTYLYMAPEVYRGEKYGSTVDICSLGIVMYKLLNNNRTPFMPPYPEPITYSDKKEALEKRICGEEIPEPQNGTKALNEIVLKACSFNPEDRYQNASEMRLALQELLHDISSVNSKEHKQNVTKKDKKDKKDKSEEKKQKSVKEDIKPLEKKKTAKQPAETGKQKKIIAITAIAAVVIIGIIFTVIPKGVTDISGIDSEVTIYIGETLQPNYKIAPKKYEDAEIKFKVGDENIIDVNEEGHIKGLEVGESILTLSSKGYKEEVTVIVEAKVTEITNVKSKVVIDEGDTYDLDPELLPEEYEDEKITYKSKDKSIATVSSSGLIKGISPGTTTITIKAGGCVKQIKVIVEEYKAPAITYYKPSSNKYETDSPEPTEPPEPTAPPEPTEPPVIETNPTADIVDEEDW